MTKQSVLPFPTKRFRNVVLLRRSRADGGGDNSPYIGLENIESWTGKLLHNSVAADDNPSALVEGRSLSNTFEPGDVLLGKLRPYLAKAWVAEFPGRSTTEFLVMQPVEVESRFLRYVCLWRDFVDAVDASTFGSRMPRGDWDFIGNMPVLVPERRMQCAIADYLDRETARLDALVAAKERVLGLLAEKRRALIARAVTQGVVSTEQPVPPARSTSFTQESQSGFDASGGEDRASAAGGDGVSTASSAQWPTKRLRYLTFRISFDNRRTRQADIYEASFLPMEAIAEQGQIDLSAIRPIGRSSLVTRDSTTAMW